MIRAGYKPPVAELFTIDLDRGSMFDLIVTLRGAVEHLEGLPDSVPQMLADITEVYTGDLPGDHPAIDGGLATT